MGSGETVEMAVECSIACNICDEILPLRRTDTLGMVMVETAHWWSKHRPFVLLSPLRWIVVFLRYRRATIR